MAAVLRVRGSPVVVGAPSPGLRLVERVREGLRQAVVNRRPEPRALVPALVLGDTSGLAPGADRRLRVDWADPSHCRLGRQPHAAVGLLADCGALGWRTRVVATLVGLAGVIIFVALCRTEPSVLRAAAMGLVALAALGSGSRTAGVRNLAVASMILLLVDPFLSRSIGFALSVLACAGIVWWARRWTMIINRGCRTIIAESIAVPLAAQLATTSAAGGDLGASEHLPVSRPTRWPARSWVLRRCWALPRLASRCST